MNDTINTDRAIDHALNFIEAMKLVGVTSGSITIGYNWCADQLSEFTVLANLQGHDVKHAVLESGGESAWFWVNGWCVSAIGMEIGK
jgi:hypothetical protein